MQVNEANVELMAAQILPPVKTFWLLRNKKGPFGYDSPSFSCQCGVNT